jgi:outer membrane immunogenic protein
VNLALRRIGDLGATELAVTYFQGNIMKLWLMTAAVLITVAPAMAADIPAAPVYKAPVHKAAAPYNWSGMYIGANAGYSWGNWNSSSAFDVFNGGLGGVGSSFSPNVDGWLGGIQAGRNWQHGSWVIGIEADVQITGEKDSQTASAVLGSVPVGGGVLTLSRSVANEWEFPWFATVRGRIGVTANNWLFFGTGGLAIGHFEFSNTTTMTLDFVGAPANSSTSTATSFSENTTKVGFALGAGVETALGDRWTAKAEYLYLDFGSHTFLEGTGADTTVKLRDHIVRVGLNYKLGGGHPVVSKY